MTSDNFSFAKFSANAFYGSLNARLVDMADVACSKRILDLGCGTGNVTQLIADRLRDARESVIIAMDHSAVALKEAAENLKDARDTAVHYVQSQVENMPDSIKESMDTIFFCNAIHYVSDKDALVDDIRRALNPGGKFAFNTSFFEGGQPTESQVFYRKWLLKASRILRRQYELTAVKSKKVESRKHLTPVQYRDLVESHGLRVVKQEIDSVKVPLEGWLDISSFEDFITGVMPGVPLEKASAALREGVTQTYKELGIQYVPRNWLGMVAVRV
jgi:ubiquinone/menaquinone biosynthesis C-methylase UbiE